MKKRLFGILLTAIMALSMLPALAFAEDSGEAAPACICETACTAEEMNADCPVCGAEGALPENCGKYVKPAEDAVTPPEDGKEEPPECTCETACTVEAMNKGCPVCGAEGALPENCGKYVKPADEAVTPPEDGKEEPPVCTCETACTAESMNASCPVCGAEGASAENCAKYVKPGVQTQPEGEPVMLNDEGETVIQLTQSNISNYMSSGLTDGSYQLGENVTVESGSLEVKGTATLDLNGFTLTIREPQAQQVYYYDNQGKQQAEPSPIGILVYGGYMVEAVSQTLTLTDSKGGGKLDVQGADAIGIYVGRGCTLNIEGGTITNSGSVSSVGVQAVLGTVNMTGGSIKNQAYGVLLHGSNMTIADNAEISDCGNLETDNYQTGGVLALSGYPGDIGGYTASTITMTGGTISNCMSPSAGGGVFLQAGSTFDMSGGTITGCKAGAASVGVSGGGGVYVGGTFNMSGSASITNCEATGSSSGGGVLVGGTFNMSGSAKITGCTAAAAGGGVYVSGDASGLTAFTMSGSAKITSCTAVGGCGGGVYLGQCSFTMEGSASITNCTATEIGGNVKDGDCIMIEYDQSVTLKIDDNVTINGQISQFVGDTERIDGLGTETFPYQIGTAAGLKWFRDKVNGSNGQTQNTGACAVLTADIDLENEEWTPIGIASDYDNTKAYSGIFDGGGHTVSGLAVSSDQEYVGLFGYTSDATIRNLTVSGSVTGTNGSAKVGGIVGYAYRSTVENCGNLCTVSGKYAAGIVGHAYNTTISACYNAGEIIGGNDAGGLVGWFKGSTGKFYDCYNVGSVRGVSGYAGGIVGNAGVCMAYNCYNAGAVIGGEAYSIGYGTDVENSYYLKGTPKDASDRTVEKSAEDFADGTVLEKLKIRTDSGDYPLPSDPWADRCQYVDAAGKTLPVFKWQGATHTHSSGGWQSDETDHWKKCDVCNAVFDKAAHSGGTATCKEKAKCAVCGQPYGELGAHSWGEVAYYWVETTTPYDFTCTAKRVCQNDENHVETETVDATYDVVREPTCLVEGQRYYTASFKNDWAVGGSELDVTIPALGHDWGEWTSNGDGTHTRVCKRDESHTETVNCSGGTATCTEKATCTDCGGKYGEKDPDNHTGKKEWTITKTKHEQKWSCCGEITVAKESHSFGKWVVTKKATSKQEGEKTRTCEVCDYVEKATIQATGAPAKTGDDSRIGMWAGILCVSLAGIIALAILYGKKHKK